jgi:hypothetical protein
LRLGGKKSYLEKIMIARLSRPILALFVLLAGASPASAANRKWLGNASAVAQVNTVTPTAANTVTYTITINGKNVLYVSDASATVAEITAGQTAAFNASTAAEFSAITAVDSTTHVTLTADVAGVPFVNTSSSTGGTNVTATTVASAGPNDWTTAGNWTGAAVPVSTDDVWFENSTVDCTYGLGQSAVLLTSLNVAQSYTGNIGLPERNVGGFAEYLYTDGYLAISATTTNIGRGDGAGSGRIKINFGSTATALNVFNTGSTAETGLESLLCKGSGANVITVYNGSVGFGVLAQLATETVSITTLRVFGGAVRTGHACTVTTLDQTGGVVNSWFTVTTCAQNGGIHYHHFSTMTTVTIDGGVLYWNSISNPTTVNAGSGGAVDFSGNTTAITVTTCNLYAGGTIRDTHGRVTWTNGIDLERCGIADVTIDVGAHKKLTIAAAS